MADEQVDTVETFASPTIGADGRPVIGQSAPAQSAAPSADTQSHGEPDKGPAGGGDVQPKHDAGRFEYWQSQYSKEREARLKDKERADKLEALMQAQLATKAAPPEEPEPDIPAPPVRPAKYDETEAYNDPQSESYKFRVAKEQYRDSVVSFMAQRELSRVKAEREARERARQEAQAQEQVRVLQADLVSKHGMEPAEAMTFIVEMSNPANVTLQDMVALYRSKKARGTSPPAVPPSQRPLGDYPTPAGVGGSSSDTPVPDDQTFSSDMLNRHSPFRRK